MLSTLFENKDKSGLLKICKPHNFYRSTKLKYTTNNLDTFVSI